MHVELRRIKGVTLIDVSGTITVLDSYGQLKERVAALVRDGEKNIVLNLSRLTFVDSSCIGELVACSLVIARMGGTLRLANPARRVQELLLITRLGSIFETYETDAEAIASFSPEPSATD